MIDKNLSLREDFLKLTVTQGDNDSHVAFIIAYCIIANSRLSKIQCM